jgi:hypothetical protein
MRKKEGAACGAVPQAAERVTHHSMGFRKINPSS